LKPTKTSRMTRDPAVNGNGETISARENAASYPRFQTICMKLIEPSGFEQRKRCDKRNFLLFPVFLIFKNSDADPGS
jgi:hypothetical protein